MNPFAAFAEDDDDDFQQAPTQQAKPVKKSKCFITQLIKKEKQSSNKRSEMPKKSQIPPRLTRKFLNTLRKIHETRGTTKSSLPRKYLPKDTILIVEAAQAVTTAPVKKEEAEETSVTLTTNSKKTNTKRKETKKSLLKKKLKRNSPKSQKSSLSTSTTAKKELK